MPEINLTEYNILDGFMLNEKKIDVTVIIYFGSFERRFDRRP